MKRKDDQKARQAELQQIQERARRRKERRRRAKNAGLHKHHRLPTSIGGANEDSNISYVVASQHRAWHTLFSNHTAHTICSIVNEKWLDPSYRFVCVPTDKVEQVRKYLKTLT